MTWRRFQLVEVLQRNGRTVACIADTRAGRDLWIHRVQAGEGFSYRHWDRLDEPVRNAMLRREAALALDTYMEEGAV